MDPTVGVLIAQIVGALVTAIVQALAAGDASVLDRPVRDLLPAELRTTAARRRAEIEAAAKYGAARASTLPPDPYGDEGEG